MKTILLIIISAGIGAFLNNLTISSKGNNKTSALIEGDKAAISAIQNDFYSALNAMFSGDSEKMLAVWSQEDDTIYMGPDNVLLQGWKEISKNWQKQAAVKMVGKVTIENEHIVIGRNMAVVHNYEVGENTDKNGEIIKVSIRATNVYRKENGQWKMIGHHTDLLPFLANIPN